MSTENQEDSRSSGAVLPRLSDKWFLQYHDAWCRLALNTLYGKVEGNFLHPHQFKSWLLHQSCISQAIFEAATRAAQILRRSTGIQDLPLLRIADENASFFTQCAALDGINSDEDVHPSSHISHHLCGEGVGLINLIDASTAPGAPVAVALTAVWSYMHVSWQAWALCIRRCKEPTFDNIATYIARNEEIYELYHTQQVLDQVLNTVTSEREFEIASSTFDGTMTKSSAVLDYVVRCLQD